MLDFFGSILVCYCFYTRRNMNYENDVVSLFSLDTSKSLFPQIYLKFGLLCDCLNFYIQLVLRFVCNRFHKYYYERAKQTFRPENCNGLSEIKTRKTDGKSGMVKVFKTCYTQIINRTYFLWLYLIIYIVWNLSREYCFNVLNFAIL